MTRGRNQLIALGCDLNRAGLHQLELGFVSVYFVFDRVGQRLDFWNILRVGNQQLCQIAKGANTQRDAICCEITQTRKQLHCRSLGFKRLSLEFRCVG